MQCYFVLRANLFRAACLLASSGIQTDAALRQLQRQLVLLTANYPSRASRGDYLEAAVLDERQKNVTPSAGVILSHTDQFISQTSFLTTNFVSEYSEEI